MQNLKQAIDSLLKKTGLENAVAQSSALVVWSDVVGPVIEKNTEPVSTEHGVLVVKTSTPTWRQELLFKKKDIIKKLNTRIGKKIIKDIRFI